MSYFDFYNNTISDQTTFAGEETNKTSNGSIDQVIDDLGEDYNVINEFKVYLQYFKIWMTYITISDQSSFTEDNRGDDWDSDYFKYNNNLLYYLHFKVLD